MINYGLFGNTSFGQMQHDVRDLFQFMSSELKSTHFAVKAIPSKGTRSSVLERTMAPHPLSFQELPYDPEYRLYNKRLTPEILNHMSDDEMYWAVRTGVILRHTGELPIEISGPDAEIFLNAIFTRDITSIKPGRCSYQFACYHDGGMITDGVLLRLAHNRFWMAQADGDLFSWYKAHSKGLDVEIYDPNIWVTQIQGPHSLDVLRTLVDEDYPEPFKYFDCASVVIGGQTVVISRTGFSNELGWEIYMTPEIDFPRLGSHLMSVGKDFGMKLTGTAVFRARRIEAGLLNAGSDFDHTTTPFVAGLGNFVDLDKPEFIGREALLHASKDCLTWGMRVSAEMPALGRNVYVGDDEVGYVCSNAWSPYLQCGVAIVRMDDPYHGPGTEVLVKCTDRELHNATLCTMPFYDEKREIPRGKRIDIPEISDFRFDKNVLAL
jgi:aminomethyltransferase